MDKQTVNPALIVLFLISVFLCASVAFATTTGNEPEVIDSVEINNENVFDLENPKFDNFLFKLANRTHFVTRKAVIMRELLLRKGDVFDTALVNESVRNLRSLSFLLNTEIFLKKGSLGENIMVVNTSDKWTTTGGVSLHRTGGKSNWQIGIEEKNLFGYGIQTSHDYFVLEDDRSFYQGQLNDNRFLGKPVAVNLFYSDNPRESSVNAGISRPFYTLNQRWGGGFSLLNSKFRHDFYNDTVLIAQDRLKKNELWINSTMRLGPNHLKYHFTLDYIYTDLTKRGRKYNIAAIVTESGDTISIDSAGLLPPVPNDSLYHYFQLTTRLQQVKYIALERINRFYKLEDFNTGFDTRIYWGTTVNSQVDSGDYQILGFWPQYTFYEGGVLCISGFHIKSWLRENLSFRRNLSAYVNTYTRLNNFMTMAIGIHYTQDRLRGKSITLYLDEDNGLRGYPAYGYNGEDRLVINIEDRFFSDIEILSVGLGGVVFADIGNIWNRDSGFRFSDCRSSVGAGMRFGVSRSTHAEVIRFDLAYAIDIKGWQISIETGQYF